MKRLRNLVLYLTIGGLLTLSVGCTSKQQTSSMQKGNPVLESDQIEKTVGEAIQMKKEYPKPDYPLFTLSSQRPLAMTDLEVIARNFTMMHCNGLQKSDIDYLHFINPDFRAIKYLNSGSTTKAEHVQMVEEKYRMDIAMFQIASLKGGITKDTQRFQLIPTEGKTKVVLRASTAKGQVSGQESTKDFVTWIRIDDELMRIEEYNIEKGEIVVTRGFEGTQPAEHLSGVSILTPVYLGSNNDDAAYPGGKTKFLRYAFDVGKPLAWQWVLVNPTEQDDAELIPEREYIDPETGEKASSIIMKALTGKILLIEKK